MKKLIFSILILITSVGYGQTETTIALQIKGGYSITQSVPVAGLELGANLGGIYLGAQVLTPVSRKAGVPAIMSMKAGYNIGGFTPFLSYGYLTAGNESKYIFKPGFKAGGGISYFFANLPILTVEIQGKEVILSGGINIVF